MRRIIGLCTLLLLSLFSFSQEVSIIPQPASLQVNKGSFTISRKTVITVKDEEDRKSANFFNDYLQQVYGFKLAIGKQDAKNHILLSSKGATPNAKDGYTLQVAADGVAIEGYTHTGTFYGIQSLIQLLPVQKSTTLVIPAVSIQDAPRFAYRGMHLDVGRHFFPISFVKKYIDYLALHKMNTFHWHLTEDQGWRIEIKKYPRLTEVGSCRNGTIIGRYPGIGNDSIRTCGYYTQDEVREIVKYAADRYITVIPEIEMPGHAEAALTAYPWLGCPGTGPYKVEETWGVFNNVFCAGNDSTFKFLQDVLDEVLPLFPSKYIHIGGDECPKTNWKTCPLCQARIKKEGLKDEHELQSYFIQRMEKYLNSKGRQIIGWDEILEGGLAPNATVMSWRGEAGGIAAAQQKHNVIMTPGAYVYFDHSQTENEDSVTIGGFTNVEKVYNYEPIPKELNAEQGKYVLGAQANVWTEYMAYPSKVEYMIFPRMSALSEVLWTAPEKKNWNNFERKLMTQFKRYDLWKANYNKAFYGINPTLSSTADNSALEVKFDTKDKNGRITYGLTAEHFQKNYTGPVVLNGSNEITGVLYEGNQIIDSVTLRIRFNKATAKKITFATPPSRGYPGGNGNFTLVDGIQNTQGLKSIRDFVGFNGTDLIAVIDLGSEQTINNVVLHTLQQANGTWIYAPQSVEAQGSLDGNGYQSLGTTTNFVTVQGGGANATMRVEFNPAKARYIKVIAKNSHPLPPDTKPDNTTKAWLFADEIEVN